MKSKTTIILIAALVLCGGYVLIRSLVRDSGDDAGETIAKLIDPPLGAAKSVTIVSADGTTLAFEKNKDWKIVQPIQARADGWKVDKIYGAVKDIEGSKTDQNPDVTGLDKPLWTVRVVDEKGAAAEVKVGRPRPLQANQTYVDLGGTAYVVRQDFKAELGRPLSEFRDMTVLDLDTADILRVQVQGRESFELKKTVDTWGLVAPVSAAADEGKVDSLLNRISRVTAGKFVSGAAGDLEAYGLAEGAERLVVRIWTKGAPAKPATTQPTTAPAVPAGPPKLHTLALGRKTGDDVYARIVGDPTLFRVAASMLDDLQPKVLDLREKKVLTVETFAVTRAELKLPSGSATLVQADGAWQMVKPLAGKASGEAVSAMLTKVSQLQATAFRDNVPSLEPFGLDAPKATVTLHQTGKDETVSLLIGDLTPSGEMTFVKSGSGKAVAVVPTADVDPLLAAAAGYWDTALLDVPAEAKITKITVTRKDGAFGLQRDEEDAWKLTTPLAAKVDDENVGKVVSRLQHLSATKIVAIGPKAARQYAAADKAITVKFTTLTQPPAPTSQPATAESQPTTTTSKPAAPPAPKPVRPIAKQYVLRVASIEGKAYAWIEGGKIAAVGEVDAGVYRELSAELRNRTVLTLDSETIENVKIVTQARTFELKRTKDEWTYTTDRFVKIDPEKVKTYLDDVKDLQAEKFVAHTDRQATGFGLDKPQITVELTPRKGKVVRLKVSATGPQDTSQRHASVTGTVGVFVLSADVVAKLQKVLDDFKK